jgi:hypothetical protein
MSRAAECCRERKRDAAAFAMHLWVRERSFIIVTRTNGSNDYSAAMPELYFSKIVGHWSTLYIQV